MYFINFKWIFDYNTYDIEIFRVGDLNFLFGDFFYGVAGSFEVDGVYCLFRIGKFFKDSDIKMKIIKKLEKVLKRLFFRMCI